MEAVALDESTNQIPARPGPNKTALRVAWAVIGVGVLVAMSAAITGGMNPNANVLPVRNLAAVIMLAGLIVVLAAYRAAWLKQIWEKSEMAATARSPRSQNDLTLVLVIILSFLLGGTILVAALLLLAGGTVSAYAMLVLSTVMPVAILSVLVYGRGYVRTFCIGAIVPLGLQAFHSPSLMMAFLPQSVWLQAGWSSRQAGLLVFFATGLLTVMAGVVAVVVRFLVEHLQGPDRQG
jgi:hypothetical protein